MDAIEKRARELLAAEYAKGQFRAYVPEIRNGTTVAFDEEIRAIVAIITDLTPPKVSETTQRLIDLLIARDQVGRAKYGTTLDRTDLTRDQWLQHMVEELLDGAGYALAAQRPEAS